MNRSNNTAFADRIRNATKDTKIITVVKFRIKISSGQRETDTRNERFLFQSTVAETAQTKILNCEQHYE